MLGVIGSNLKMVKSFTQHLRMLHDVVVVWPGSGNNAAPWACELVRFSTRNMSQDFTTWWPNAPNMLRPTMLRQHVAIVWLELENTGATMLRFKKQS